MSDAVRATCYELRNPPKGIKRLPFNKICELVRKKDKTPPSESAVRECVKNFKLKKNPVGRPQGSRVVVKRRCQGAGATLVSPSLRSLRRVYLASPCPPQPTFGMYL